MTQEALKLALEALNDLSAWNDGEVGSHMDEPYAAEVARRTITAIKEALAQTQEPVEKFCDANCVWTDHHPDCKLAQTQEPVAYYNQDKVLCFSAEPKEGYKPVYTTPLQRTEQNFCSRCGKRTADLTTIHTCTPPHD
jgi:hypothetical protein